MTNCSKLGRKAAILAILFCSTIMSAQPVLKEKRIYLVDITASMVGEGKNRDGAQNVNIFGTVKESLSATLSNIEDPSTEIVIIPYTKQPKAAITGTIAQKDSLVSLVNGLKTLQENTNIADAWSEGLKHIDTTKVNYMFLLTDGRHNTGPTDKTLYQRLSAWGEQSQGHAQYAFYVMLTPNAKEMEICRIVDETRNLWLIESMDINASLIKTSPVLRANIFENNEVRLFFDSNNSRVPCDSLGIRFELEDNDFYELSNFSPPPYRDAFRFEIIEKQEKIRLPVDTTLALRIIYNKEKLPFVFVTPDIIDFNIANQGPRIITINQVSGSDELSVLDSLAFGKAVSHETFRRPMKWCRSVLERTLEVPPFCWCKDKSAIVEKQLVVSFNEEAVRAHSKLSLSMRDAENNIPPFTTCHGDTTLVATAEDAVIRYDYTVNPGQEKQMFTGKLYAISENVDMINGTSTSTGMDRIAGWSLDYRRRGHLVLWILWVLSLLLALAIAGLICYLFYLGISYLLKAIFPLEEPMPSPTSSTGPHGENNDKKKENKKRKKKDLILEYLMFKYNAASLIHKRIKRLQRIKKRVQSSEKKYEARYEQLTKEIRFRYDQLVEWEASEYVPSNLISRFLGAGKYMPDPFKVPKNGNCYGNVRGLNASQINKENHIRMGLRYIKKQPDFSKVAKDKVVLRGKYFFRYEADIPAELKAKGVKSVHERVIRKLAIRHLCSKEKIRRNYLANLDEPELNKRHLLTIHECVDLKTIYVVPREVHTLYYHSGAIGLYQKVFLSNPDYIEMEQDAESDSRLEGLCKAYHNAKTIKDKSAALIPLSDYLEDIYAQDRAIYDKTMLQVPEDITLVLNRYWDHRIIEKQYAVWDNGKREDNGSFSINLDAIPTKFNDKKKTFAKIFDDYEKDFGLKIHNHFKLNHRRLDLSQIAIASVKVRYEDSNLGRGGGKGIQDIGIPEFARILEKEIKNGGYYSFYGFKDCQLVKNGDFVRDTPLVIHESYDCETLYLVPKIIHDNIHHFGGIHTSQAITGKKVSN